MCDRSVVLHMSYPQHMQHLRSFSVCRPEASGQPKPVKSNAMVSERQFGIRHAHVAARKRRNAVYHKIRGSLER
jgi:hypothetical protein